MFFRNETEEDDYLDRLDFAWASIEADEYQKYLELEDAEEKGKSLGLAEGVEQNKKATAKELYKNNVSMSIIQKVTGFSEAQIRNICL